MTRARAVCLPCFFFALSGYRRLLIIKQSPSVGCSLFDLFSTKLLWTTKRPLGRPVRPQLPSLWGLPSISQLSFFFVSQSTKKKLGTLLYPMAGDRFTCRYKSQDLTDPQQSARRLFDIPSDLASDFFYWNSARMNAVRALHLGSCETKWSESFFN